jgi:predicted transcriptional regulator of viral defense system
MNQKAVAFLSEARAVRQIEQVLGPAFTRRDLERKGLGDRALLSRLLRAGYVRKVSRGLYEVVEAPRVRIAHEFVLALAIPSSGDDAYISWRSALAHYGLTEQMARVVYVAVAASRLGVKVSGARVQFVIQGKDRRYDVRDVSLSGTSIRMVSPEKAVIDGLDRPDLSGGLGEVVGALASQSQLDYAHLIPLALEHPSGSLVRRLGYLMTVLHLGDPSPLRGRVGARDKPMRLDLDGDRAGEIDKQWQVIDNVGVAGIRDWALS